jgi:cytochrome c biogenesis protein CcdA/thiol-disulfide isomerase/thioredoxin
MTLFFISLLAGILTVVSPCVLPLLPVIVGGSLAGGTSFRRALTVTLSLGASVFLFTLLLKASTLFINVPQAFWNWFSGLLVIAVGLVLFFPKLYDRLPLIAKLNAQSNKAMSAGFMRQSFWGDVLVGAALGPVFSSCSPTYFIVLASVLPVSLALGIVDIIAYVAGLCIALLFVSFVGQRMMLALGVVGNPEGWFKRILGIIFILVGLAIISGVDKVIEAPLYSVFDETTLEQGLLAANTSSSTNPFAPAPAAPSGSLPMASTTGKAAPMPAALTLAEKQARYHLAPELPAGDAYLNTGGQPISLAQYRGKNVVLIDFWTYSCINCIRTLPYVTSWYQKYKDQGLVIIGVHTPEFSFEHVESNVADALTRFGITYPVVLDNEYNIWNAFQNQYWPREYLIDIDGFIVHDHAGEGEYDETEKAIQAALMERAERMNAATTAISQALTNVPASNVGITGSPETYFGSARNEYLANGTQGKSGVQTLTLPSLPNTNALYLGGTWDIEQENATNTKDGDTVEYTYDAQDVYFVASADSAVTVDVLRDGIPVGTFGGKDVTNSTVTIHAQRLYHLIHEPTLGTHTLLLKVHGTGLHAYTFTFG